MYASLSLLPSLSVIQCYVQSACARACLVIFNERIHSNFEFLYGSGEPTVWCIPLCEIKRFPGKDDSKWSGNTSLFSYLSVNCIYNDLVPREGFTWKEVKLHIVGKLLEFVIPKYYTEKIKNCYLLQSEFRQNENIVFREN